MRLEPFYKSDFSSGQVNNVNPTLTPRGAVELGLNLDFDEEIGSAVSRLGTEIVGSQLVDNVSILGLHQHIDTDTVANNVLFAALNASGGATSTIRNVTSGANVVTGLTANAKMRFLTYNGETLAINGADAERAWNGSSWITTGGVFDLADFPGSNSCDLVIEFLDRIYTAGDSSHPTRLHFSTIFDGSTISWAGDYIDIEKEGNAGPITALAKVPGYLLIFKERSMHRFNGSSAFPESLVQIGTPAQESVVVAGGLCAFYSASNENAKGFYLTDGGRPIPLSHDSTRPIKKWVDAISSSTTVAGFATDRGFAWSVGDLTVDGETWNNVVLRYNRFLQQWSVRTYPSQFTVFAQYLVSGVNTIVGGDDDGTVFRVDKQGAYSDNGTAIQWVLRDQWQDFGFNQFKRISDHIYVRGKNLEGARIGACLDDDLTDRVSFGAPSLWKKVLSYLGLGQNIQATSIAIEIVGETTNARACIREIELPTIEVDASYRL
jgi:hypothetical protein